MPSEVQRPTWTLTAAQARPYKRPSMPEKATHISVERDTLLNIGRWAAGVMGAGLLAFVSWAYALTLDVATLKADMAILLGDRGSSVSSSAPASVASSNR